MKKVLIIGLIVAFALIIVGGAGVAYASIRGANNDARLAITRYSNGDEFVRQFKYGTGSMMNGYAYESCPGGMMQGYGPGGMMGGYTDGSCPGGYGARGMMGRGGFGVARGEGPMHEYMVTAFAEAVDLTAEEVEERHDNGETMVEIAIAQGIAEADLPDLLAQVRTTALNAAVADGVITQAQADFMLERMENNQGRGFGPGFNGCPMLDADDE
jgi:hypothetical protein